MKKLLFGRVERRFHLQLSQAICFQSVKLGLGFVYYLCLGFNLRRREQKKKKGNGKGEEKPVYFRAVKPPCQATFRGTVAF